jgi:uncharacterized membrane protein YgcG
MRTPLRIVASVLVAAACVGCPGALQDPGRFDDAAGGNCPDVPQLLATTCGSTAACHTTKDKQQGLDLQSADPASRLVGVSATEGLGLLVDPSNPPSSVLYTKITTMPPFGARMPFGRKPLDDATIACVLDWVTAQAEDAGALDSGTAGSDAPAGTDSPASTDSGSDSTTPKDSGAAADAPTDHAAAHDASSSSSSSGSSSSGSGGSSGGTDSSLGPDEGTGDAPAE